MGEWPERVGVGGMELLPREGDLGDVGVEPSPAAASVRRNSTHNREKDCVYLRLKGYAEGIHRKFTYLSLVCFLQLRTFAFTCRTPP